MDPFPFLSSTRPLAMASTLPISQSQAFSSTAGVALPKPFVSLPPRNTTFQSWAPLHRRRRCSDGECPPHRGLFLRFRTPFVVFAARTAEMPKKDRSSAKGFVEEMRAVAMKLHTRDQAKEGEKEPDSPPVAKWEPSLHGYLRFLVDSKLVYDTLETIVRKASHPWYAEFRNTGLERSEKLAKDLEWFKEQGHVIPEPSSSGISYACYLEELSEKDPQAFICHFYNVYFAHTAGGRIIGKKVAEKILNKKELEFYKWDGDLSQLLQNVRDKLNQVASSWSREEKNHCLEETEKSFKFSGEILRLIVS